MKEDPSLPPVGAAADFRTTHWSVVLAAGRDSSPQVTTALETLCRTCWYPLYAFVRRKGHNPEDAQDLTQAFFARLLEKNYVAQADRERERFRTFLLAALSHFLADGWDKARRLKRGGGREMISFDAASAEERCRLEPIDRLDAPKLYERRWVTTLFDQVLARLEQEFRDSGKGALFDGLKSSLLSEPDGTSYAELGARLGLKIALISPHGRLDPSFNLTNDVYTLRTVYAIVPQPDGKILVGVEGTFGCFRLQPDGALDMSFARPGFFGTAVRQIALQGDGKILNAGEFSEIGRVPRLNFARLNADGSVDSTFDPGLGANDIIRALLLLPDGRILIGGLFTNYNRATQYHLARLNPDASLDPIFLPGTNAANGDVYFLDRRGDKILAGGDFTAINGVPMKRIARLNMDGSLDPAFRPPGGAEGGPVYTISEQAYGQLVIGGRFTNVNGAPLNYLARLNADGSLDRSFQIGTGAEVGVFSTAVVPTGDLLVGGALWAFDGVPRTNITRLVGRGGPFLQIGHEAGGQMGLSWHTNAVGFRLESREELRTGDWHSETNPPATVGGWNTLLLDPTNHSRSFRLFKP